MTVFSSADVYAGRVSPQAYAEREETARRLHAAFAELPERVQQAVRLRLEGLTFGAIGAEMGLSGQGCRYLWLRGLRDLEDRVAPLRTAPLFLPTPRRTWRDRALQKRLDTLRAFGLTIHESDYCYLPMAHHDFERTEWNWGPWPHPELEPKPEPPNWRNLVAA